MLYVLSAVGGVLVLSVVLFKAMWRVAEPDEALVISGLRASSEEGLGFKVVTGKGTLVLPGVQAVRRLSLDLREAELAVDCVTTQGIPVSVKGVVIFKVGDDMHSIGNAARRFLDQQGQMETRVHNVFAGHLRAIVGQITMEEMIRDREKLTALTRQSSGVEMEKLGLIVDSLQIQEIDDPTGYIENLGRPYAAAVASAARIAQADADRAATESEQVAEALKAEAVRHSQIKQYGFQAEIDESAARAEQAGPLADAAARQEVVRMETKVAELEAHREEQRLQATVRKPADAQAYHDTTLAKAQRDARISAAEAQAREVELHAAATASKLKLESAAQATATRTIGDAEAHSLKVKGEAAAVSAKAQGLAAAAAIKARGEALAEHQDAVIGQTLAESWPAVVAAAAAPFGEVEHMVMLNGATGIADVLAQAMTQGAAGLGLVRSLLGKPVPPSPEVAAQNGAAAH
jgi:flotillin